MKDVYVERKKRIKALRHNSLSGYSAESVIFIRKWISQFGFSVNEFSCDGERLIMNVSTSHNQFPQNLNFVGPCFLSIEDGKFYVTPEDEFLEKWEPEG